MAPLCRLVRIAVPYVRNLELGQMKPQTERKQNQNRCKNDDDDNDDDDDNGDG